MLYKSARKNTILRLLVEEDLYLTQAAVYAYVKR